MKNFIISSVLLFGGHVAESAVIIQPVNISVSASGRDPASYDFDLNQDGTIDWSLWSTGSEFWAGVNAIASPNTFFVYGMIEDLTFGVPIPLPEGSIIGDSLETHYFWGIGSSPSLVSIGNSGNYGGFLHREGYLGFQFQSDEGTHYAYAYLINSAPAVITVSELAWETEPGKAIRAGNIPEPTTSLSLLLALLAATQIRRR